MEPGFDCADHFGNFCEDEHFSFFAVRTSGEIDARKFAHELLSRFFCNIKWLRCNLKKFPAAIKILLFRSIGEEAKVADTDEGGGYGVEEEAVDELKSC